MTGKSKRGALPRIPALDGIRTVAVAAVFAYHAGAGWLPGGFLGVDMFFALSGFLITSILLSECRRTGGIKLPAFWLRRARRLLPAVVVLIAAVMLVAGIAGLPQLSSLRWNAISGLFYFANWHQIFGHVSYFSEFGRPPLLRHLWSLSLEEQFYLFWPPIMLLAYTHGGEKRVLQAAVVLAVLSAADLLLLSGSASVTRVYEGTDTRASTLLLGAIAAMWWSPQRMRALAKRVPAVAIDAIGLLCAGGLLYLMMSLTQDTASGLAPGLLVAAVLSVGLIVSATDARGVLSYVLSRRVMVWLGERSYGIYLWHWPVIVMTRNPNSLFGESIGLAALQVAITVALAAASYTAVERPIRQLGLRGWWDMLKLKAATPFARGDSEQAPVWSLTRRLAPLAAAGMAVVVVVGGLGAGVFARASAPKDRFPAQPSRQQIITELASSKHTKQAAHHHKPAVVYRYEPEPTAVFGDSVVLGTEASLTTALGPDTTFNAAVGRQPQDTIAAVADTVQAGELPKRVVISLGDNGLVTGQMLKYLKSVIPHGTQVVIVTPRVPDSWGPESAATIRGAKAWWPGLKVADWAALSGNENGWFNDGVHPDDAGILAFVRLIKDTLAQFPPHRPPPTHNANRQHRHAPASGAHSPAGNSAHGNSASGNSGSTTSGDKSGGKSGSKSSDGKSSDGSTAKV